MEEGLSLKDEALFILFESSDGCISAEAFNAVFAELIYFVEVTSSHTNDTKMLHETLVVKVMVSRANNVKTVHETFVNEVTGSRANNAKTLHETFVDQVADLNPV